MSTAGRAHRTRADIGVTAVAATIAVMALAGCGDDGEADRSAGSTPEVQGGGPTKAHYIARADAACRDALRETGRLGRRFDQSLRSGADVGGVVGPTTAGLFEPGIQIRKRQAERLRRLERPAEDRETLDVYLDLFDPIEELMRQRVRAGRADDADKSRKLESLIQDLAEEQSRTARSYGFRDCDTDFVKAAFPGADTASP